MRAIGLLLGAIALFRAVYEYVRARHALKVNGSIVLPQHLVTAPMWVQWINRREVFFRAYALMFISILMGVGSLAPAARSFDASKASVGTNVIMSIAVFELCGVFISLAGKWIAAKLRQPNSNVTAIATRSVR